MNKIESKSSIKRRINARWGFSIKRIVLMEASYSEGICDHVDFNVCGVGYSTDLRDHLIMNNAYDLETPTSTLRKTLDAIEAMTFSKVD